MNIEMMETTSLQPYEKNPRKNEKAVQVVSNSIQQYGFQQPIVVDNDRIIIVGHTRYRAAKNLGIEKVPVLVAKNLDEKQTRSYRIMDNRSNENAQWDESLLFQELEDLITDSTIQDLAYDVGYTENELEKLFREDEDPVEVFNETLQIKAREGDLYTLGEHKLVCGDSTNKEHLELLLGDDKIDLLWEDPPYGVTYVTPNNISYTAEENLVRDKNRAIKNDNLSGEELDELLDKHLEVIMPYWRNGGSIYWSHDINFNTAFRNLLEKHKVHVADTLIWKKKQHSTWLTDYAKTYEPIIYGWKKGAEHKWYAKIMNYNVNDLDKYEQMSRDQLLKIVKSTHTNVFEFGREDKTIIDLHPTVKPVKLIAYHIYNSTKPGEIVYDGFSGSGSTLMACEKTGRVSRSIEYDPKYVDVIIKRWQDKTGAVARHSDGTLWNDMEYYDEGK
jgi:site-specific DNA-methyltransferase (adenine-specific)